MCLKYSCANAKLQKLNTESSQWWVYSISIIQLTSVLEPGISHPPASTMCKAGPCRSVIQIGVQAETQTAGNSQDGGNTSGIPATHWNFRSFCLLPNLLGYSSSKQALFVLLPLAGINLYF